MKDVRIDSGGHQRCWNCGGSNFTQQRTARSKVAFGLAAALSKAKLRCVRCGEYNDVGSATPYTGPADRKYAAEWKAEQATANASLAPTPPIPSVAPQRVPSVAPVPPSAALTPPTPRNCRDGHENPGTAKFCLTCGSALNDAGMWCLAGHLSPAGTHFCGACGRPTEPVVLADWDPDADHRSVSDHEAALAEAKERVRTLMVTPDIETGLKMRVQGIAGILEAREGSALARARNNEAQVAGDSSAADRATADGEVFAAVLESAQYRHDSYDDVWHLGKDDPVFTARQKELIARQRAELTPRILAARLNAARLSEDPARIRVAELVLHADEAERSLGPMPMGTDLQAIRDQVDYESKNLAVCRLDYALAIAKREAGDPYPEAFEASQRQRVADNEALLKSKEGLLTVMKKSRGRR